MKYFAYGSNLDQMQMAQRCPGAKLTGVAVLADHRICFPRRSQVRGCAVASIEPYPGQTIWGVIYEIDADDLGRLDAREGFDPINPGAVNRYERRDVLAQRVSGEKIGATTYVALPEDDPGLPSADYMKHIIHGAVEHSFPEAYIEMLKAVEVCDDGLSPLDLPGIDIEEVKD